MQVTMEDHLDIESKLITLERPLNFRYTDQDQKHFFPNDKGLEFVDDIHILFIFSF